MSTTKTTPLKVLDNYTGTITLTNCVISGNTASVGGGIYNYNQNSYNSSVADTGTITLTNCIISGNTATNSGGYGGYGGGVYNSNYNVDNTSSVTDIDTATIALTNCTLAGNTASGGGGGGGVYNDNSNYNDYNTTLTGTITLTNDILYGDIGTEVANDSQSLSNAIVTYCDVQGGFAGTGNINANPLFVNAPADLHLLAGSPCSAAGTASGAPATDKDGRSQTAPPSIGAYEVGPSLTVPGNYHTIQDAINAAHNGDTVTVADGTYSGPGDVDLDFLGKSITVTSQNGPATTIIDCQGSSSANHRGFFLHSGEMSAIISGFTIKNGYVAQKSGVAYGAEGGGICIVNNSSSGGAITVASCILTNDYASIGGGGIYAYNTGSSGSITVIGCTLFSNSADDIGGGIWNENANSGDTVALTGCALAENYAAYYGGSIDNQNDDGGTVTVTNSTLTANNAVYYGGGVYNVNEGGTVALTNCSLTGNGANTAGGGVYSSNYNYDGLTGAVTLTNDILYGDTGGEVVNNSGSSSNPVVTYCDVQGGYSGTGNLNADPLFFSAPTDLHLQPASPCIGKGTHSGAPTIDKDGATRSNPPSIGAYEGGLPLTVPGPYPTIQSAINAAQNGQTVTVADGTYSGNGNRDLDFLGKSITVTSQHGAASAIIDCQGSSSANHRGFYIHSGEANATISGFTIKNGYEAYTSSIPNSGLGGGIFIYNTGGAITVAGCAASNNTANYGGGAYNENAASGDAVALTNCAFAGNTANYQGGGVYNQNVDGGTITLTNATLAGNTADENGGGVFNDNKGGTVALTNCSLTGNAPGTAMGGGVYSSNYNYDGLTGAVTLTNDILYGDAGGEVVNSSGNSSNPVVTYCDVQGGYSGTGNLNADPVFVNAPTDLHIQSTSPCAAAGTHSGAPTIDKDGKSRPNPPSIGAFQPNPAPLAALALSPTSIYGGAPAYGRVTLAQPAIPGGQTVSLSSNSSLVTVPASVTVPAGYSSATFALTTASVTADTPVTITATQGTVTETATVTLLTKYTISGTVTKSGAPLPGASVSLNGSGSFLLTKNLATVQAIPGQQRHRHHPVPRRHRHVGTISDLKLGLNITHPSSRRPCGHAHRSRWNQRRRP